MENDDLRDSLVGVQYRDVQSMEYVSEISEFVELNEFLQDEDLEAILNISLRCLADPSMTAETARNLLVRFQAASVKFGTLAVTYTTLKKGKAGSEENFKKNIYYTLSDLCDKMAQSMKYIVRRYGD